MKCKIISTLLLICMTFGLCLTPNNTENPNNLVLETETNKEANKENTKNSKRKKNTKTETQVETIVKTEAEVEKTETVKEDPVKESETIESYNTNSTESSNQNSNVSSNGKVSLGTFKLTAYCGCQKCCGKYALNRPLDENGNPIVYGSSGNVLISGVSIAADINQLPFGTKVEIDGKEYIVHDTGGAIKGNRIDVYFDSHEAAYDFAVKNKEVFILK